MEVQKAQMQDGLQKILGSSWAKTAAYILVTVGILTMIGLSIKRFVDSDDEEQKKFGRQLGISVGVIGIIGLLIAGYVNMPENTRNIVNFLLEFFPYLLLMGGIGGLFYLVFPDKNITEDLKDVQKRLGIVAGIGTAIIVITAILATTLLRIDPGSTFFPFTMIMTYVTLQLSLLSFLSIYFGKV